jgi:hypothetical protein
MTRFARGALATFLLLAPAAVLAQDNDTLGGFEGRWEGALKVIPAETYDTRSVMPGPERELQLAILVRDQAVTVYTKNDASNNWQETKPGHFQLLAYKSNATVTAIDSSNSGPEDGWVETWNLSLTHKDRDSLLATVTRVVNNYSRPADATDNGHPAGRFFVISFGEMRRVR